MISDLMEALVLHRGETKYLICSFFYENAPLISELEKVFLHHRYPSYLCTEIIIAVLPLPALGSLVCWPCWFHCKNSHTAF